MAVTRNAKQNKSAVVLAEGQVWRLPKGFIEIVKLGKTLAHYRRSQTEKQRGVPVTLAPINDVAQVLKAHQAELVRLAPRPARPNPAP